MFYGFFPFIFHFFFHYSSRLLCVIIPDYNRICFVNAMPNRWLFFVCCCCLFSLVLSYFTYRTFIIIVLQSSLLTSRLRFVCDSQIFIFLFLASKRNEAQQKNEAFFANKHNRLSCVAFNAISTVNTLFLAPSCLLLHRANVDIKFFFFSPVFFYYSKSSLDASSAHTLFFCIFRKHFFLVLGKADHFERNVILIMFSFFIIFFFSPFFFFSFLLFHYFCTRLNKNFDPFSLN